jgi:hypothetical protein
MAASAGLIGVANTLQNRVGNSLGAVQLLTPELSTSATLQAGATSIGTMVLNSIKEGQDRILESTNRVVELLSTQVDIQEEAIRRERERRAELDKENLGKGVNTLPIEEGPDKGKVKIDKEGFFGNLDVGDIAAVATAGGLLLKNVAGKVIKGGAKGGFYGILASFLAKPAIDFLEEGVLKVDIPEEDEKKLENAIIAGASLYALAGLPGALIGLGAVGVNSLINYITGEQEKFSAMDASMLFAGGVGVSLLSAKAVTALTAAGWVKSAGILGAITATPVLIGIGVAIALGVAVNELVKFNEHVQKETLAELEEVTKIGREELTKRFVKQKESFLENLNMPGLANMFGFDISDLNKAKIGTEQALDEFKDKDEEFDSTEQKSVLKSLDGILLANNSDLSEILYDKTKTQSMLDTVNAARQLAVAGAFGPEKSKELLTKILKFGSNVEVLSQKITARNEGTFITKELAKGKGDLLDIFNEKYMESYNRYTSAQNKYDAKEKEFLSLQELEDKLMNENAPMKDIMAVTKKREQAQFELFTKLGPEKNQALGDMQEIRSLGLYKEGSIGFDPMLLKEIYSDAELNALIKIAAKKKFFDMNSKNIEEKAFSERQPGFDVNTAVSSTNTSIKHGDMITTPPSHTVDGHLQGAN